MMSVLSHRRATAVLAAVLVALISCVPPSARREGDGLVYVALGDSSAAGPLITLPTPPDIGCVRSTANYPSLVAEAIDAGTFIDRTCGDATIEHLTARQRLAPLGIDLAATVPPQFDSLGPDVDIVTISIGGNTAGLPGFGVGCVNLLPFPLGPAPLGRSCQETFVRNGVDSATEAIADMEGQAGVAFGELRERAPNAEIFVVGYQRYAPDDGAGCNVRWPILDVDAAWLARKVAEMNAALRRAADAAGLHFVDLAPTTLGHDACRDQGEAWINGITFVPDGIPLHPNSLGAANTARVVTAAIRSAD